MPHLEIFQNITHVINWIFGAIGGDFYLSWRTWIFYIIFCHTCIFLKSFQEAFANIIFVEGCVQAAYVTFGSFFHSYISVLIWPSTNALSLVTPQCMVVSWSLKWLFVSCNGNPFYSQICTGFLINKFIHIYRSANEFLSLHDLYWIVCLTNQPFPSQIFDIKIVLQQKNL